MSTPRVLLVDDEPNMRWTMAEFLKRGGYEVLTASDFDSAMTALGGPEIDAAVIDIVLPGKSGVELLKELSSRATYLPVVMITGEPNPSLIPEIVRAGAYDFIAKPILKEALIKAVSRAVEKKRLVDEKGRLEQEIKRHAESLRRVLPSAPPSWPSAQLPQPRARQLDRVRHRRHRHEGAHYAL